VRGPPDPRLAAVCLPQVLGAPLTKDLKQIYTAPDEAAAAAALEAFAATWGERYPAIVKLWRAHWSEFTPFLAFPPEVRRVIYTTDENVNPAAIPLPWWGVVGWLSPRQLPDLAVRCRGQGWSARRDERP
jgi:hypothetical protein